MRVVHELVLLLEPNLSSRPWDRLRQVDHSADADHGQRHAMLNLVSAWTHTPQATKT